MLEHVAWNVCGPCVNRRPVQTKDVRRAAPRRTSMGCGGAWASSVWRCCPRCRRRWIAGMPRGANRLVRAQARASVVVFEVVQCISLPPSRPLSLHTVKLRAEKRPVLCIARAPTHVSIPKTHACPRPSVGHSHPLHGRSLNHPRTVPRPCPRTAAPLPSHGRAPALARPQSIRGTG